MKQFKGGWMNGVATEIAQEIGMLLENADVDTFARQEKPKHHAGRTTADDAAAGVQAHRSEAHGLGILLQKVIRALEGGLIRLGWLMRIQ
jgi:hypothetical protein